MLIGDSSLAGVRWYDGASERLRGATFTLDAESCRRVAVPSCGGREDRIPLNVVERILQATPEEYDAVVVMSGYNDAGAGFEQALNEVVGSARAVGIAHTVFLTLTTPTPGRSSIVTAGQNQAVRAFRPGDGAGDLWFVADWQTYSAPFMDQWYEDDHVHLSPTGSYAAADFISRVVANVLDAPCPGETSGTCPIPTAPRPEAQADFTTAPAVRCLEVGESRELVCEPAG
ncbi:MAG: SGNH/GDSL hydrolase family protein [Ilumatobacter sp.]|uniref:SGNH/GDSL hydrolase family protein n=1 Tax=Ilumatobacter sp. TaxID=1967498 RepID=UPI00260EFB1C|nr:SGNH/GDSL hydrolase family protein [Ilumatobacter sp.]MDJ0770865.1 SGNH/GDSL hydrolase family protein [Ilumatobacter sp.]